MFGNEFFIKSIRADELDFFREFTLTCTHTPQQSYTFPLRKGRKKAFTVDGTGVQERAKKPAQYTAEQKNMYSKATSLTLVTQDITPKVFGFNRERCEKIVGMMFAPSNVLLTRRFFVGDYGTVHRFYDFHYKEDAEWFYQKWTTGPEVRLFGDIDRFKIALAAPENRNKYNEVLGRIKWTMDGNSCLFIASDNLESRCLAQDRARILRSRLKEQVHELGMDWDDSYQVPICFYLPGEDKHLKPYDERAQIEDRQTAESILLDETQRQLKASEGNFEFLLVTKEPRCHYSVHDWHELINAICLKDRAFHVAYAMVENSPLYAQNKKCQLHFQKILKCREKEYLLVFIYGFLAWEIIFTAEGGNRPQALVDVENDLQQLMKIQQIGYDGDITTLNEGIQNGEINQANLEMVYSLAFASKQWDAIYFMVRLRGEVKLSPETLKLTLERLSKNNEQWPLIREIIDVYDNCGSLPNNLDQVLECAIYFCQWNEVRYLFSLGRGIKFTQTNIDAALKYAFTMGVWQEARFISNLYGDNKPSGEIIAEALKKAIEVAQWDEVEFLLQPTNENKPACHGEALHSAAKSSQWDLVRRLAVLSRRDEKRAMPWSITGTFECCINAGQWDMARSLASVEHSKEFPSKEAISSAFRVATRQGLWDEALFLVNLTSGTVLDVAAEIQNAAHQSQWEIVMQFWERCKFPDYRTNNIIHLAAEGNQWDVVRKLAPTYYNASMRIGERMAPNAVKARQFDLLRLIIAHEQAHNFLDVLCQLATGNQDGVQPFVERLNQENNLDIQLIRVMLLAFSKEGHLTMVQYLFTLFQSKRPFLSEYAEYIESALLNAEHTKQWTVVIYLLSVSAHLCREHVVIKALEGLVMANQMTETQSVREVLNPSLNLKLTKLMLIKEACDTRYNAASDTSSLMRVKELLEGYVQSSNPRLGFFILCGKKQGWRRRMGTIAEDIGSNITTTTQLLDAINLFLREEPLKTSLRWQLLHIVNKLESFNSYDDALVPRFV